MDIKKYKKMTEACIECGNCTRACKFLAKYNLKLNDVEKLCDLAYHCYLCNECYRACPVDISGKNLFIAMRRDIAYANGGKMSDDRSSGVLSEKIDYRFRNYRHITKNSVFFPGCNFISLYPKTGAAISKMLKRDYGIGTVHDCCGKPIAEAGLQEEENRAVAELIQRLSDGEVEEIITACPNCYYFLKDRLGSVRIVNIYEKFMELGVKITKLTNDINVYIPCPDRDSQKWLRDIELLTDSKLRIISSAQCCGLGGLASGREPELTKEMVSDISAEACGQAYSYCASCTGQFARAGIPKVRHILSLITGIDEKPDTKKSYLNRALQKLR